MQYALIGVLAVAAWIILGSSSEPTKPATKKVLASVGSKKGNEEWNDSDLKAKAADFEPVAGTLKDAFKPLIVSKKPAAGTGPSQVNVVPPAFAGGEPNWTYTGSAQIDGVLEALLENKVTGDSVFLKVGDTWKGISVEEITDDSLVLASPITATEKKLELPPDVVTGPAAGPGGFAPANVNSPLRGNIGPMGIQPDPTMLQDPSGGNNGMNGMNSGNGNFGGGNGGGGGRRGGRGRNRGGGGGGNGGFGG